MTVPKSTTDSPYFPTSEVKVRKSRRRAGDQYIALKPSPNITITLSPAAAYRLADELVDAAETIERSGRK